MTLSGTQTASDTGSAEPDEWPRLPMLTAPIDVAQWALEYHGSSILICRPEDIDEPSTAYLLDSKTGLWIGGLDTWYRLLQELTYVMLRVAIAEGQDGREIWQLRKALQGAKGKGIAFVQAVRHAMMAAHNPARWPKVTVCKRRELDMDLAYLGTPTGVVSLRTGKLLSADEARKHLVTYSTAVKYRKPSPASAALVERLVAHMPEQEREWLWQAFGAALWGPHARRMYCYVGEPGGGKTTLLEGIRCALGSYFHAGSSELLAGGGERGTLNAEAKAITIPVRICVLDEIEAPKRGISRATVKRLTGGGSFLLNEKNKAPVTTEVTATIFFVANPESVPRFGVDTDQGMRDRYLELRYPRLPAGTKKDRKLKQQCRREPAVQEAILYKLVQYAAKTQGDPPDAVPSVEQASASRAIADAGMLGGLAARLVPCTGNVHVSEVWEAWCKLNEDDQANQKSGNIAKVMFSRRLRKLNPALPDTSPVRARGKQAAGWAGFRFEPESDQ
ncbi:MAG: hypothetical protein OXU74_06520 [Gemmatimonadota bacterium]|nr:hypothetical protein [Gemmatimonadota bacterium]